MTQPSNPDRTVDITGTERVSEARLVNVAFEALVYVIVDMETSEVTEVAIDMESLKPSADPFHAPVEDDSGKLRPVTEELAAKAVRIADDDQAEWPAWNFGR
jgi:hypothetical protein